MDDYTEIVSAIMMDGQRRITPEIAFAMGFAEGTSEYRAAVYRIGKAVQYLFKWGRLVKVDRVRHGRAYCVVWQTTGLPLDRSDFVYDGGVCTASCEETL